jgi:glycosyltransferase involved in cell wall biosynthesis
MTKSSGDITVIMDGDLQDPPELIPKFISQWECGGDVVYASRKNRKENFILKTCYYLFYRLLQKMTEIPFPLDAGDFCLLDRRVLNVINGLPERSRFIRGMRAWSGFTQVGVEYDRDARTTGKTKYSVRQLFRLAVDGITGFSNFPLRLCVHLGWIIASLSLLGFLVTVICRFFIPDMPVGWASILASIFFLGGVQLTMLGVVGTYIGRIYKEVQRRPLYLFKGSGNLNIEDDINEATFF